MRIVHLASSQLLVRFESPNCRERGMVGACPAKGLIRQPMTVSGTGMHTPCAESIGVQLCAVR